MNEGTTTQLPFINVLQSRLSIKTNLVSIYILLNSINGKPVSRLCTGKKLFKINVLKMMIFLMIF